MEVQVKKGREDFDYNWILSIPRLSDVPSNPQNADLNPVLFFAQGFYLTSVFCHLFCCFTWGMFHNEFINVFVVPIMLVQ